MGETGIITSHELLKKVRSHNFDVARFGKQVVEKERGPVGCTKGCAVCCNAKILTHAGEGLAIYIYLREQRRWTPALAERIAVADRLMAPIPHNQWEHRAPCVFLKVDPARPGYGRCTVYPARPYACAATFSTNADPADCGPGIGRRTLAMAQFPDARLWRVDYLTAVVRGLGDKGSLLFTLPGAVLWAAALIEKRPPPAVFFVDIDDCPDFEEPDETFDRLAAAVARRAG